MTQVEEVCSMSKQTCSSSLPRNSEEYFGSYKNIVANLPYQNIDRVVDDLVCAFENGATVFILGNGGSAALASHFACDLGKGTVSVGNGHRRFRVMALTDNIPLITAWANDTSYEQIFAEQLRNFVTSDDVVFAISGSGNSPNVLRALEVARDHNARTIGLTGFKGGSMKGLCDVCVIVPSNNMQIIEDFHLSVTHAIFSVIRQKILEEPQAERMAATGSAD
jgi:D-sedoheptulose 7-phosphate isomerase